MTGWSLRPYQLDMVARTEAALTRAQRGVVTVAPTGSGKTRTFVELVQRACERGERACILVHRRELLDQTSAALRRSGVPHGLISPESYPGAYPVHVASVDTLRGRRARLAEYLRHLDLLIVDECHHVVAEKYQAICRESPQAKLSGWTASPYRLDGKGLGDAFDESVIGPSTAMLTELGWLVPGRVYQPPMPNMSFEAVRTKMGEYVTADLDAIVNHRQHIMRGIEHWQKLCRGRPTILFANSVAHAKNCEKLFRMVAGAKASSIDATTPKGQRDAAVRGLADGSTEILINVEILGEGYDSPAAAAGIFFRKTKSVTLLQQQFGRLLRPDDIHEDAIVLDLVGNVRQLGMPDEARPWSLLQGLKNLEKSVAQPLRCHRCHRVQPIAPACVECGTAFAQMPAPPAQSAVPTAALSPAIRAMSRDLLLTMKLNGSDGLLGLARTRADLEHIAQMRNYKPNWVKIQLDYRERMRSRFSGARRQA